MTSGLLSASLIEKNADFVDTIKSVSFLIGDMTYAPKIIAPALIYLQRENKMHGYDMVFVQGRVRIMIRVGVMVYVSFNIRIMCRSNCRGTCKSVFDKTLIKNFKAVKCGL